MSKKTLHTKFGTANLTAKGYYIITSSVEGNYNKKLHILIYEDYHRLCILPGNIVHHIDADKTNNDINNLQLMSWGDHTRLHHTNKKLSQKHKDAISKANKGRKPFLGRHHSLESRKKMRLSQKGRIITDNHKLKLSKAVNKVGYFRVSKQYSDKYSQGFRYRYIYTENGKRKEIKRVNLNDLKKEVIKRGLIWKKLD